MAEKGPKVSVLVATYNHERFIERAIRSALFQEADFEYEIIIGDDCSTDGTRVVLGQLDADFPGRLRLLLPEQNLGPMRNFAGVYAECRGEYVAFLEGDDYWTDMTKLRKQVASLDADPGCALCYHQTLYVNTDDEPIDYLHPPETTPAQPTIDDLFRSNLIQTCSAVLRRAAVPKLPDWMFSLMPGDWALFLLAADVGRVRRLDGVMATYRVHQDGVWSQLSVVAQIDKAFTMLGTVDRHFNGKYAHLVEVSRITMMKRLCDQTNYAREETIAAQRELAAVRQELALVHQELSHVNGTRSLRLARALGALPQRAARWMLRPLRSMSSS
jgi:glycosyltransferase involved in cell wall biosynthesis